MFEGCRKVNGSKGVKVLFIAPNENPSHFALEKRLVNLLLAEEWVHEVVSNFIKQLFRFYKDQILSFSVVIIYAHLYIRTKMSFQTDSPTKRI